jgi:hypothetical protein
MKQFLDTDTLAMGVKGLAIFTGNPDRVCPVSDPEWNVDGDRMKALIWSSMINRIIGSFINYL